MDVIGKALAAIAEVDDDLKYGPHGGFTCIASTPSEDRDGDNLYQEEWKPLPEHVTVDLDHGMSVATTVGSGHSYFNSDGNVQVDVALSSISRAQEARTLIKEGHIRTVSVAFMTDKSKKSGEPRRELLNLGIVAIPSNREAVILDSKALDARAEELAAQKATEGAEVKADDKPYGDVTYADPADGKYPIDTVAHIRAALAYINVAHNYEVLGAHAAHVKAAIEAAARSHGIDVSDPHGKSLDPQLFIGDKGYAGDGKSQGRVYIDVIPRLDNEAMTACFEQLMTKASATASGSGGDGALVQAIHDASSHLGAACPVIEVTDESDGASDGANKSVEADDEKSVDAEAFEKALDRILTPEALPAEAAAASSVEEPAPAVEAADEKAKKRKRALELLQMRATIKS